jgi:hypothetical protein
MHGELGAFAVAFALSGCPGRSPRPPDDPPRCDPADCCTVHEETPSLEVGEGDPDGPAFVPLEPGADLGLHDGPQGGYHVYLAVRTTGICPNQVRVSRVLRAAGDDEVQRFQHSERACLVDDGSGARVLARAPASFVCPATQTGIPMHDAPFEMDVTVTELEGCGDEAPRTATATARFVPVCPPDDEICRTDDDVGCAPWDGE